MALTLLLWCQAALLLSSGLAALLARRPQPALLLVYGGAFAISLTAMGIALGTLVLDGPAQEVVLPLGLPWLGAHFRLDALAAFFALVVNLGAAWASLQGLGLGGAEREPWRVLPFYPAFLAGMNLVLLAADAFSFLLAWEFMSLVSWALVVAHHREAGNLRAGLIYLTMAGFGTLALLFAFGLMAGSAGSYAFAAMRDGATDPLVQALVLALALAGAGSKAGLAPLHVWLPLAHPAAPSHVSALMSGAMTKVAIYGFIRLVFDLVGDPAWWMGLVVVAAGAASALLGILHALTESDIKRLLAYSTIENVGAIFVGLGLALAFQANAMTAAAALSLAAALLHVFNHALFKNLLFLGAGALLAATGERDLRRLGGLARRMPATAGLFLAGCMAGAALPPLNGFVSEWLLFQAILQSPGLPQWGLKIVVPAIGGVLALSAALAAAVFVKTFGIAFLGRARSEAAAAAHEVGILPRASMALPAAFCLLAGILPGPLLDLIRTVTTPLLGGALVPQAGLRWLSIVPLAESRSSYNGLLVLLFVALTAALAALALRRMAGAATRRAPAWDCGFAVPVPLAQYSESGFAQPLRRILAGSVFRIRERVEMPAPGALEPARFAQSSRDPAWSGLYLPLGRMVEATAGRLNALQFLTIRRYLSLVFGALVLLLMVVALWT
ncbi:MAG: hydrogenase 4 subunit B [Alphaproteobacteria bacterium]|nr:hydrogenase 4 subunit B [Alphaproteobacteria bacterium]